VEYEADIPDDDTNLFVVEGTICSGEMSKFVLSRSLSIRNSQADIWSDYASTGFDTGLYHTFTSIPLVRGANVSVRGSDGSEYMAEEGNGYYYCQIGSLSPDADYYLHIETEGEVYESEPQKPLPTEKIAEVTGGQDTRQSNIDVLVTPDVPMESDKANYYSWTYDETWEVRPEHTTNIYFDIDSMKAIPKKNQFPPCGWKYAVNNTIHVGASTNYQGQHIKRLKLYEIDRTDERLFYKYSGMVHQRAITKAEYEYELARRQASSEMGGLFTPQPSALPTNIRCLTSQKRVIGFVGCSLNKSEHRFFFHDHDFFVVRPPQKDDLIWLYGCDENDCRRMVEKHMFLCEWIDNRKFHGRLSTSWAYERQLNVCKTGAFAEEPDFWRLDEDNDDNDDDNDDDENDDSDDGQEDE
jgi:hypothetical protein